MRKAINGLSELVESAGMGEMMGPNLFVFTNRRRVRIKVLYFNRSGSALWMKRLEKDQFPWPEENKSAVVSQSPKQFRWLPDGCHIWKMKPFEKLNYAQLS